MNPRLSAIAVLAGMYDGIRIREAHPFLPPSSGSFEGKGRSRETTRQDVWAKYKKVMKRRKSKGYAY